MPRPWPAGAKQVLEEVAYNRKPKGPDLAKTLKLAPLLSMTHREEEIAACDLVIEAIVEKEDAKKQLYRPARAAAAAARRFWPATPRRFRSRGWPKG